MAFRHGARPALLVSGLAACADEAGNGPANEAPGQTGALRPPPSGTSPAGTRTGAVGAPSGRQTRFAATSVAKLV